MKLMESIYILFFKEFDMKKPASSLKLQITVLKYTGFWPPEEWTGKRTLLFCYKVYAIVFRIFYLYFYTFTQILFFTTVENLGDFADASFLLLTQVTLIYKIQHFTSKQERIRKCIEKLNSDFYRPHRSHRGNENGDEAEILVIKEGMKMALLLPLSFHVMSVMVISSWGIVPLLSTDAEIKLPIAAKFPFDVKPLPIFICVYLYQVIGIALSALTNVSWDTISSALMAHVNSQIERLGIQLSLLGHEDIVSNKDITADDGDSYPYDEQMRAVRERIERLTKKHGRHYGEVAECILFHQELLQYAEEIEDIFSPSIFAQLMSSVIIMCTTGFLLINVTSEPLEIFSTIGYLIAMAVQILFFCWRGNEIIYSSHKLTEKAYCANFQNFDRKTSNMLICFMQRTSKNIQMKAGGVLKVTLSLPTFVGIIKSSYSYFAVLQSMQNK